MKWYAIPLRENGTERMGTEGVLRGEYKRVETFIRYRLIPYGSNPFGYALFINSNYDGSWIPRGKWVNGRLEK